MKAIVRVRLKSGILDPQGKAVNNALHHLGYNEIQDVRIGKLIELTIENGSGNDIQKRLQEASHKLLANPIIEDYEIEMIEEK